MIRKFNYTDRKRIPKERVVIRLEKISDIASFDAQIDLSGLGLPGRARIYIEPYFKAAAMRFDFGTVAEIIPPTERTLTRIPQPELAFFRFKVVDESEHFGRLLANANRLIPLIDASEPSSQTCIFRVNVTDTGRELWRLDLDEDGPILEINRGVEGIKDIARIDPTFLTCVYPSLVRQVLTKILIEEHYYDPGTDYSDWRCQWLLFASRLGAGSPPKKLVDNDEQVAEWIESAVQGFCRRQKLLEKYVKERQKS